MKKNILVVCPCGQNHNVDITLYGKYSVPTYIETMYICPKTNKQFMIKNMLVEPDVKLVRKLKMKELNKNKLINFSKKKLK